MKQKKKVAVFIPPKMHSRNKHLNRYDFSVLVKNLPELADFVIPNFMGDDTIDFFNPDAVLALNKSLLKTYYNIVEWDLPIGYLCPPIPGRADYIHHIADLLCTSNYGRFLIGDKVKVLDIGVGANCIFPIIGSAEYGWSFIGAESDELAFQAANKIVSSNAIALNAIEIRKQATPKDVFFGMISKDEIIDVSICNPPFHASAAEAQAGSLRKLKNLSGDQSVEPTLNFGGQSNELWCDGGEERFVHRMVKESKKFSRQCFWFSSLISKQSNLKSIYQILEAFNVEQVVTIPMGQGNKTSRIVAWTFLSKEQQKEWKDTRWCEHK